MKDHQTVSQIREGFRAITPYLFAQDAAHLIEFISRAFGGVEAFRKERPDGAVIHAEMRVGDSMLMLGEATPQFRADADLDLSLRHRFGQRVSACSERWGRLCFSHHDTTKWGAVWWCERSFWECLVDCHAR